MRIDLLEVTQTAHAGALHVWAPYLGAIELYRTGPTQVWARFAYPGQLDGINERFPSFDSALRTIKRVSLATLTHKARAIALRADRVQP